MRNFGPDYSFVGLFYPFSLSKAFKNYKSIDVNAAAAAEEAEKTYRRSHKYSNACDRENGNNSARGKEEKNEASKN